MGVSCVCDEENENLIIENTIEDEIMEAVREKEYTYADYIRMIEAEEKIIEELDNEVENVESELEDIEVAIDLAEAARLSKIKSVYEEVISRRKEKEAKLEELESELEGRRNYLHSLREDDYVDREADAIEDRDSLTSAMDAHIEKEDVIKGNGVYKISNTPCSIGTEGKNSEVLF